MASSRWLGQEARRRARKALALEYPDEFEDLLKQAWEHVPAVKVWALGQLAQRHRDREEALLAYEMARTPGAAGDRGDATEGDQTGDR